jgi:hypothetical protein
MISPVAQGGGRLLNKFTREFLSLSVQSTAYAITHIGKGRGNMRTNAAEISPLEQMKV